MMDVPHHLLNPPAGGWHIKDAALLWVWLVWGIPPTAHESSEVQTIRADSLLDMWDIAKHGVDDNPTKNPGKDWVTRSDFAALAAQRGIPFGPPQPPPAGVTMTPWRGGANTAPEQPRSPSASKSKTKPTINAEAYEFITAQLSEGIDLGEASKAAAIKFPRGDEKLRTHSLYNGYKQWMKNHTE